MIFRTTDQACLCGNARLPSETCLLYACGDDPSVNHACNFLLVWCCSRSRI